MQSFSPFPGAYPLGMGMGMEPGVSMQMPMFPRTASPFGVGAGAGSFGNLLHESCGGSKGSCRGISKARAPLAPLQALPLTMCSKVCFSRPITPVLASLPDDRADLGIVHAGLGGDDLVEKLTPEATCRTMAALPPPYLAVVVIGAATKVEATVPLEPSIRIEV